MRNKLPIIAFTGAAGRVGRNVVSLLREDWDIRALDICEGDDPEHPIRQVDILDSEATLAALRGAEAIVHCAIAGYKPGNGDDPDNPAVKAYHAAMLEVNIKGTYNVFEAARILRIPQVVFISSLTVVTGYASQESHLEETLPPCPRNVYACTKLFGEQLGQTYSRLYGICCISLRLGQPYPLGLPQEKDWIKDPKMRACFVSHQDTARAITCALRAKHLQNAVYNIVSKNEAGVITCEAAKAMGFESIGF